MATTATMRRPDDQEGMEKYRRLLDEKKASLSADLAKTRNAEEETTEESTQDIADKAVSSYTREFLYSLSDGERTRSSRSTRRSAGSTTAPTGCCRTAAR